MGTEQTMVEVTIPSRPGYERVAAECSASFAGMTGLTAERVEDIRTAVAEACANAMEHGSGGRGDARVTLTLEICDGAVVASVWDAGPGIREPPSHPSIERKIQGLEPPKGWGLFLIRGLADEVDLNVAVARGHAVKMVFKSRERTSP